MSSLVSFEIKKFFSRKKNLIVIALFFVLSVAFILLNLKTDNIYNKSEGTTINLQVKSVQNAINRSKADMERLPNNKELKNLYNSYLEDLNTLKDVKLAYDNKNIKKYLQAKIVLDKKQLDNINIGNMLSGEKVEDIQDRINLNTILMENNIQPINAESSMQAFNFIKLFLNSPITIVIIILIIIASSDVVSSEYDSNTYKLLFTQPIGKRKILLSKFASTLLLVNIIVLGVLAIDFLSLGFVKGFGSINYPTMFYGNIAHYIGIGKFFIYDLILFILVINSITILSLAISSFSKSTSSSMALAITVSVAIYMISSKFSFGLSNLNLFSYIDVTNVIHGKTASLYKNQHINFNSGVIVSILTSIIILSLAVFFFEKNKRKTR